MIVTLPAREVRSQVGADYHKSGTISDTNAIHITLEKVGVWRLRVGAGAFIVTPEFGASNAATPTNSMRCFTNDELLVSVRRDPMHMSIKRAAATSTTWFLDWLMEY